MSEHYVTFETGRHYKVHKSYVYVAPILAIVIFVFAVLINGMQGWVQLFMAIKDGEIDVNPALVIGGVLLGLALLIGAFYALYALAYRNMSYVFDEREFSFYSGIITKRRVHAPYARVQSVNHRASLIQRLFGVCTVIIDSAGGSSNRGVRVPYLRLETAERLRVDLFERKAAVQAGEPVTYVPEADPLSAEGSQAEAMRRHRERSQAPLAPHAKPTPASAEAAQSNFLDESMGVMGEWRGLYGGYAVEEPPVSYELKLENHELLLTSVSHDGPLLTACIVGVTLLVSLSFILLAQDDFSRMVASFAAPIIIGGTLVSWAFGLLAIGLSYGNFRLRRRGTRIEVERGLLARDFSGIDIDRVQSIEVRQSVIRRLLGYCELSLGRINAAGESNKGNSNSRMNTRGLVIHPFVKIDRVDEILDALVPELADRPRHADLKPLPRVALRRAVLRRCIWYNWTLWVTIAIAACWGVMAYLVSINAISFNDAASQANYISFLRGSLIVVVCICAALTAIFAAGAVLWARHSGYTWNRRFLVLYNDGLSTAQSTIPRRKIQSGTTRDNPFQRRLHLTSLIAVTAAGTHSTTAHLIDVPSDDGAAYLEWLK